MRTFVVMLLIETTLFIDKPHARTFVLSILGLGLLLRALVAERKEKAEAQVPGKSYLGQKYLKTSMSLHS